MLRTRVGVTDFDGPSRGLEADVARFLTGAMSDTVEDVKEAFRAQVRGAGLGDRLANAIRGTVYPNRSGRSSLEPTGWVYAQPSRDGRGAAAIIESYANGRSIVPRAGKRWLLVPTDDCPRKRGGAACSYEEVEQKFGRLEWIPAKDKITTPSQIGRGSFHVVTKSAVIRKSTQAFRPATARERLGKTRNPRPLQLVILFEAVRAVRKPKSVDLSVPEQIAQERFPANLDARWR